MPSVQHYLGFRPAVSQKDKCKLNFATDRPNCSESVSSEGSMNCLSRKPLLTRDASNFENLFDKLHIYILALMRIRQDDNDVSFSHVRMFAALMRALKSQTL